MPGEADTKLPIPVQYRTVYLKGVALRNRRFGVEIECAFPGGFQTAERWLRSFMPSWFDGQRSTVGCDGSGTEIRSPILSGPKGFRELRQVMEGLTAQGASATSRDGMHVHHDAPEFVGDEALILRLVKTWMKYQAVIESFVDPIRAGRHCCPRWTPEGLGVLEDRLTSPVPAGLYAGYTRTVAQEFAWKVGVGGRAALNLHALHEHGSLEFRLHEGTVDADRAESWIKFGQGFLNAIVQSNELRCPTTPQGLLKTTRVPTRHRELLLSRAEGPLMGVSVMEDDGDPDDDEY